MSRLEFALASLLVIAGCAHARPGVDAELRFGADAARRELWEEARLRFERATVLRPDDGRAWNNLGVALEATDRIPEAIDAYQRAVETGKAGSAQGSENRTRYLLRHPDPERKAPAAAIPASTSVPSPPQALRGVKIPTRIEPVAGVIEGGRMKVEIKEFEIEALSGLDVADEVRRFLVSEIRSRTPLGIRGVGIVEKEAEPSAVALPTSHGDLTHGVRAVVLRGRGRLVAASAAMLGGNSIERDTVVPTLSSPARRTRWGRGYSLSLELEVVDAESGAAVWRKSFTPSIEPRERTAALFALYEMLGPIADELVTAVAGSSGEERRILVIP